VTGAEIDYDRWYPEVPAVMDTGQLAGLLGTNVQIVRAWVREGIIPAHRRPGGSATRSSSGYSPTGTNPPVSSEDADTGECPRLQFRSKCRSNGEGGHHRRVLSASLSLPGNLKVC